MALITGGASGIGRAIAQRFVTEGATVIITDLQADAGEKVSSELGASFLHHDVTDEGRWNSIIDEILGANAALNILVNNAGILSPKKAGPLETSLGDWRKVFAVNVEGTFLGCRTAMPAIARSGGGSIINISSVASALATPFAVAYGASKAAVSQLTKSMAQYSAERRFEVRCNSIHPGLVRTPAWDAATEASAADSGLPFGALLAEMESVMPSGGFVSIEEVAAAAAFLASDEARHVTGSELMVDGGMAGCNTFHNITLTGRR